MNTRPCDRCEHHKSKANKTPGKLIPNMHGKCTRPGGLCEEQPVQVIGVDLAAEGARDLSVECELEPSPCTGCDQYYTDVPNGAGVPAPGLPGACLCPGGICDEAKAFVSKAFASAVGRDKGGRTGKPLTEVYAENAGPAIAPQITEERGAELVQLQNTSATVDQAIMDAEEVFRDLGRIEAAVFYATVSDSLLAQTFQKIKKNKSYKNIPYVDANGKARRIASLDEFCEVKLGKSARRMQELSQNLNALGPDLYESAERIGFRTKDYRALKALPAEEQAVVKQALASESKDEVLGILEDLAARHHAEREAAKKEAAELKADLDARDQLLETKTKSLDKTQMELAKLKSLPPAERARLALEREAAAVDRLSQAEVKASAAVNEFLGEIADVLEAEGISIPTSEYACNLARFWAEGVGNLFAEHGIAVDFEGIVRPEWTRDEAAQGLGLEVEG